MKRVVHTVLGALALLMLLAPVARAEEPRLDDELRLDDEIAAQLPPKERVLQWSLRLGSALGARRLGEDSWKFIMETNLQADWLWGYPGNSNIRFGPAVEVRSASFSTLEAAAGGTLLLPLHPGWPLTLTPMFGVAGRFRDYGEHAPVFVGKAAFGYRSYNYHHRYGVGIGIFTATRVDIGNTRGLEVTGGVELDIQFAVLTPILMIKMATDKRDPDEPENEEGDYYEGY